MNESSPDELARRCADSMYKRDTAARGLGISLLDISNGVATMQMTITADMLNGHDICHGGFIFTLADTAFAYACNSYNKVSVAQNCDIDFLIPGREGDVLTARAKEVHKGGRSGLYDVEVVNAEAELVAQFRGRSFQLKGEVIADA